MEPCTLPELCTLIMNVYDLIEHNSAYVKNSQLYNIFMFRVDQFSDEISRFATLFKQLKPTIPPVPECDSDSSQEEPKIDINLQNINPKISVRPYEESPKHIEDEKFVPPTPFEYLKEKNYDIVKLDNVIHKKEEIKPNANAQHISIGQKEIEIKLNKNQRKRKNRRERKEINKILGEDVALNPENMNTEIYAGLRDKNFKNSNVTPGEN